MSESAFYQLQFNLPNGDSYPVERLKGKTILVVNTATKCGLAPQFKGLERLHDKYENDGLVVLGFPCNQFAGQEPETNETMLEACEINHGVTFQLLQKIDVNGSDTHPVFGWLKKQTRNILRRRIKWNFTKFLISPEGTMVRRYSPVTKPEKIEGDIIKLLK